MENKKTGKQLIIKATPSENNPDWAICSIKLDGKVGTTGDATSDSLALISIAIAAICHKTGYDLPSIMDVVNKGAIKYHSYLNLQGVVPSKN